MASIGVLLSARRRFLVAAAYGGLTWWSDSSPTAQVLAVLICLLLAGSLTTSLSIGLHTANQDVPWLRIGIVVTTQLLACATTMIRSALA